MSDEEVVPKKKMYCGEFGCLILIFLTVLSVLWPSGRHSRIGALRASCQNNLKQMGLMFKMYADEHKGNYPSQNTNGCNREVIAWSKVFDIEDLVPEYLSDPHILLCPSYELRFKYDRDQEEWESNGNPDFKSSEYTGNGRIDSCEMLEASYTYYGYVVLVRTETEYVTESSIQSFRTDFEKFYKDEAIPKLSENPQSISLTPSSIVFPKGEEASKADYVSIDVFHKIQPLREGVERFYLYAIGDSSGASRVQSNLVIMHDRIPKDLDLIHTSNGVNVLFMDGHVEFVRNDEAGQFVFGPVGEIVQRRW